MKTIIECEGIWKSYGKPASGIKYFFINRISGKEGRYARTWALQDISFSVERGSAFGIVGHNGTGKSTLLSLLLGTIQPDKGKIKTDGRIVSLLELGAGFHPDLSGWENIFLYGAILGMSLKELHAKVDSIIEFSELASVIKNPIQTYSSGMIARLGFSTIVHVPANIILIDEILAVGDLEFKQKCSDYLSEFRANGGTLVIVSHEIEVLESICDTGMLLHLGKVVTTGSMQNVLQNYKQLMQGHDRKSF